MAGGGEVEIRFPGEIHLEEEAVINSKGIFRNPFEEVDLRRRHQGPVSHTHLP